LYKRLFIISFALITVYNEVYTAELLLMGPTLV